MAVLSRNDGREKLSLWGVTDPFSVTRLKSETYHLNMPFGYGSLMKMDEHFISIFSRRTFNEKLSSTLYFFFKKTLDLHWQKKFDRNVINNFSYGKGLLLIYDSKRNDNSQTYGIIQVYNVTTRTCVREMHITVNCNYVVFDQKVGLNSKFMVAALRKEYKKPYKMNIYDLEAVKNPKSTEAVLLVYTIAMKDDFAKILMDETAIICENEEKD